MADTGVHNIKSMEEYKKALEAPNLVVIDCFATWCGPCKVIAPKIVGFSSQYPDAHFYKVDVDEIPDVAQELSIRAMPTILLFKNGIEKAKIVGANHVALEAAIKEHLES
ncbi:Cytoplasmic thioredoxin isoenzyme 2 [Varicellaria rhodocarpa]|nr:Cytoplasmic thioredoxin isoenzyme 2 [Varicellaria rhodocarpa]